MWVIRKWQGQWVSGFLLGHILISSILAISVFHYLQAIFTDVAPNLGVWKGNRRAGKKEIYTITPGSLERA
jgi:hypothetical protein